MFFYTDLDKFIWLGRDFTGVPTIGPINVNYVKIVVIHVDMNICRREHNASVNMDPRCFVLKCTCFYSMKLTYGYFRLGMMNIRPYKNITRLTFIVLTKTVVQLMLDIQTQIFVRNVGQSH